MSTAYCPVCTTEPQGKTGLSYYLPHEIPGTLELTSLLGKWFVSGDNNLQAHLASIVSFKCYLSLETCYLHF